VKRRTIAETFESLRRAGRIALMPFIPAGYPDLETTAELIPALEAGGANLIEIGFPFSDPIADGPIVQEAFAHALARKVKVADVFATVASARSKVSIPLLGMLSFSIVYRHGVDRFVAEAKAAGLDGLILPDLPPPEAQQVCERVRASGLETVLLIAPTTTPERRRQIAQLSSGFVYYLSVTGITGERDQLPADLAANVRGLKQLTDRPVCVGFGISQPRHVKQLVGTAEGAIVGSFIVRRMKSELSSPRETLVAAIRNEVAGLSGSTG
jgi:tryptophan synthase alpha chain